MKEKINQFKRNCPECRREIVYKSACSCQKASEINSKCRSCSKMIYPTILVRICQKCEKKILYDNRSAYRKASRLNSWCQSCAQMIYFIPTRNCPKCGIKIRYRTQFNYKTAIQQNRTCRKCKIKYNNSIILKRTCPICGKELFYSSKDAYFSAIKRKCRCYNCSFLQRPNKIQGSGWCGYYNGHYFRSTYELNYIVNFLEKNNLQWKSGECKELKIPYKNENKKYHFYYADFLVEDKELIEIKPLQMQKLPEVKLKQAAAAAFCESRGWTYRIIDPGTLSINQIENLIKSAQLKWTANTQEKYLKYLKKKHLT